MSSTPTPAPASGGHDTHVHLQTYFQKLDAVSQQTFPHPFEKLQAISQIAKPVSQNKDLGTYISGLWTSHLSTSLAWSRVFPVLNPTSEYVAPSWSSLSVNGQTSSLFLDWKDGMFEDQRRHPEFIAKYKPKLLSYNWMHLVNSQDPYGPAKEGSYITISGSITMFKPLLEKIKEDEDDTFHPTFVLDQSSFSDCSHCHSRSRSCTGEQHEQKEKEMKKFEEEMDGYVVLFLDGAFWGLDLNEGDVDCVVLKIYDNASEGVDSDDADEVVVRDGSKGQDLEGWERIGFLRLSLGFRSHPAWEKEDGSFDHDFVERKFGELGWARRTMNLF